MARTGINADIQTARIPLYGGPEYRGIVRDIDQRFVNGIFEVLKTEDSPKKKIFFVKRPGLLRDIRPSGGAGVGRGLYSWQGSIYTVIGTKIYKDSTDLGVTLTTATGRVTFAAIRPGAATPYLCVNDGFKLYAINGAGVVTTVTVNFPSPNTTDLIYFDGYLFTLDSDGTLWNCNIDDPTTWDNTKWITAIMQNGTGVSLARQNNFLCLFTTEGMQLFYDSANATGSPMSNVESGMLQIGCTAKNSVCWDESEVTWIGRSSTGGYSVWNMDGISNATDIGNPVIARLLSLEGSNLVTARAKFMRVSGHKLYILDLASISRTFVYDFDLKIWYEWTEAGADMTWPISCSYEHNGDLIVLHDTNGWVYKCAAIYFDDDGTDFEMSATLSKIDFDTMNWKTVRRISLIGNQVSTTTPTLLTYSDDDYQTWSTARTLDQMDYNPTAVNLGRFRRRAFRLSYTGSHYVRWEALEVKYRLGQN